MNLAELLKLHPDTLERQLPENYKRFAVHLVSGPWDPLGTVPRYKKKLFVQFNHQGDHVTCQSVTGALPMYLRFGGDGNDWIPMIEGATYTRRFQKFAVRAAAPVDGSSLHGALQIADAVLYASHGRLLELPPKQYGMKRQPFGHEFTLAVGSTTLFDLLRAQPGYPDALPTLGRGGGTIIFKNTDLTNTCWLRFQEAYYLGGGYMPSPSGFPLGPGEQLTLQLEQLFMGETAGPLTTPVFYVAAGTCKIAMLVSDVGVDMGAPEQSLELIPPIAVG